MAASQRPKVSGLSQGGRVVLLSEAKYCGLHGVASTVALSYIEGEGDAVTDGEQVVEVYGVSVLATRKPRLLTWRPTEFLLRNAERRYSGA
jgi:hypothetical protein